MRKFLFLMMMMASLSAISHNYYDYLGTVQVDTWKCALYDDKTTSLEPVALPETPVDLVVPDKIEYEGVSYTVTDFGGCRSGHIRSISLPKTLLRISSSAFRDAVIDTGLVLPQSIIRIESHALTGLECPEIVLPDNEDLVLESYALSNCPSVTSLVLRCKEIGYQAFYRCPNLESVTLANPELDVEYGYAMFAECPKLKNVIFLDGIKAVGFEMFMNCKSLTSISLPSSVETLEKKAFRGCESLEEVVLSPGVKEIRERAFYDCTNLSRVEFGDNVELIDVEAFRNTALKRVRLPRSLKKLGMFSLCCDIESDELPDGLYYIGTNAMLLSQRESLRLPLELECMWSWPFGYDFYTPKLICPSVIPPHGEISENAFSPEMYNTTTLVVPEAARYYAFDPWFNFLHVESDSSLGVTKIASEARGFRVEGRELTFAEPETVSVYNASGAEVFSGETARVSLSAPGLYIVKHAATVSKIIVR